MPLQELVHMAAPKERCFCSTWCKMYWAKVNSLHISLCCDHDFPDVPSEVPLVMLNLCFQNCKLTTYPGTDPHEYQILCGKKAASSACCTCFTLWQVSVLSEQIRSFVSWKGMVWSLENLLESGISWWYWSSHLQAIQHVPKVVKQAEGLSGSLMHPTGSSAAFCWLLSLQAVLRESLKGSRVLPRNWETLCGSPFQSQSKDLKFFMYYTLESTVPWTSSINFWQGEHLYSCLFTHSPYTRSYSHLPGRTNKAVKSKLYPSAASAHLIHHSPMDYNQWRKWKKCLQSSPVCKCACESVLSITPSSPDNIFNESHHVM